MGCSPSIQGEEQIQLIQSERRMLSQQYSTFCSSSEGQPFQFQKKFAQGISITEMKKEIVLLNRPCQFIEDDPIFQIESLNDSFHKIDSISQTQSSKGILKSQKDANAPQKKVSFDQKETSRCQSEEGKTKKKKIKLRKSIFMR